MFFLTSCETNSVESINIDNESYVFIDTRDDEFYNGFIEEGEERGGHIKNAVQFSAK